MGELTVGVLWIAPISTVLGVPPTGMVPITGEGGNPPPTNIPERDPPQLPPIPIAPDPFNRLRK
jgi:hypothetical protein